MIKFVILTGASASGKSTAIKNLKKQFALHSGTMQFYHFDSIGVPPMEEMVREFGSPEEWQRAKTHAWIEQISNLTPKPSCVILEGQMRIAFLKEALQKFAFEFAQILLLDCSDAIRRYRLEQQRKQPELMNEQMVSWAAYLRKEAHNAAISIIDTSSLTEEEVVTAILTKSKLSEVN